MARLWARIIRKHRIERQATRECTWEGVEDALTELCREFDIPRPLWLDKHVREFDIPRPLWLDKHVREFEEFRHTAFLPDHFMEDVPFQKLEIEFLEDNGKSRKSNDPRNQFDF